MYSFNICIQTCMFTYEVEIVKLKLSFLKVWFFGFIVYFYYGRRIIIRCILTNIVHTLIVVYAIARIAYNINSDTYMIYSSEIVNLKKKKKLIIMYLITVRTYTYDTKFNNIIQTADRIRTKNVADHYIHIVTSTFSSV